MLIMRQPTWRAAAFLLFAMAIGTVVRAQEDDASAENGTTTDAIEIESVDDRPIPHEPVKARTPEEQKRLDAASWYMAGRMSESRNEYAKALDAYKKAVELDPKAVEVYRSLVPLAFNLNQNEEALKYAMQAVELDPSDFRLMRRLAVHMAGQGQIEEAISLLQKALESPEVERKSGVFVLLNHDLAKLFGGTGRFEDAAKHYEVVFDALLDPDKYRLDFRTRAALQADPSATYQECGQVFLQAKQYELAIKAFEKAAAAGKQDPALLSYNLAQVYAETNQLDKALEQLQKYLDAQLQSRGAEAYELLASILEKSGRSGELVPKLEELAAKDKHNRPLHYFLAEQHVAREEYDKAEKVYKGILKGDSNPQGYLGLAKIYRLQERPVELLDALHKAAQDPETLNLLVGELEAISANESLTASLVAAGRARLDGDGPKLDFPQSFLLAKMAAGAEKTDDAIAFFRHALTLRRDRAALVYEEMGRHLIAVERYDEAIATLKDAAGDASLSEVKPSILFLLSQAQEGAGDVDGALKSIGEARDLMPDNPLLHFQQALINYQSKRYDEAIKQFQEIIGKYPQHPEFVRRCQLSLSNLYLQMGDAAKSQQMLEEIYAADPEDPSVNNDLGYLYADQGVKLEQAEGMIRKALATEPENPAYLDSMGWVLYRLGKYDEALPYLEKATGLPGGGDGTIWSHLGDIYEKLDQKEKAIEAWTKARESFKESPNPDAKLVKHVDEKLKGAGVEDAAPESETE